LGKKRRVMGKEVQQIEEGLRALLVLSRIPGIGPARLKALVDHFGNPTDVASRSARDLAAVEGIERKTASIISAFYRSSASDAAERFAKEQIARTYRYGGTIISIWDSRYPSLLKKISDPPSFLFIRGSFEAKDENAVAIVGTRSPSAYGMQIAERFASGLAGLGITIVSGLARGIDTMAHTASVRARGRTIAVIGSGIDIIYPSENIRLAERITAQGAVISEFPMGTKPDAVNFPRRNRIVSGMSLATLVIETPPDGGAMITARTALDQGRDVFAIPSSWSERKPSGTNLLIKEGKAKLTETVEDVLADLGSRMKGTLAAGKIRRSMPSVEFTLFERKLLDAMGDRPVHVDPLAARAGFSVQEALVHLLALEFKGGVRQLPGKVFVRL
jgi:DNA processing protein